MAASEAIIGWDSMLEVEDAPGSGVFVALAEITNIQPPNKTADKVDVTHMKSPNRTKEKRAGLIDPGDAPYELNHIPGSATDVFLVAWNGDGTTRSTRITYPNAHTQTFPAFVGSYAPKSFNASAVITSTLTLTIAGAVVEGP